MWGAPLKHVWRHGETCDSAPARARSRTSLCDHIVGLHDVVQFPHAVVVENVSGHPYVQISDELLRGGTECQAASASRAATAPVCSTVVLMT